MNADENNVSTDQQLPTAQETAPQGENLSPPDDTPITSSLQAGINYCRSMADQMVDEINSLENKYDSTRQNNRVLRQNLVDLENEKQKLIADFQEDFRKFNSLNSCVKGLEEEVMCLKGIMDPSMKLEADITQTRIEELKIRSSLRAPLEEQQTRFQETESSLLNFMTDLKEKMQKVEVFYAEFEIFNDIGKNLVSHIDHFDSEIRDLTSIEDFSRNKEDLEETIDSLQKECSMEAAYAEAKEAEISVQIPTEFEELRFQKAFQEDKIRSDFGVKQNILDDLKMKTIDKLNQTGELDRKIEAEENVIRNGESEMELLGNELRCLENKLLILEQEKIEINETLNGLLQEIQFLKQEQSSHTEERENLRQNSEQLKIKEEILLRNLDIAKDKIELNKKLTEIMLLKKSKQEEYNRLENEKQQLFIEKENLDIENANLTREISAENQRFFDLQKILQTKEVLPVSNHESESELIDQLRIIKTEECSQIELKEAEFDDVADKFEQIFSNFTDLEFSLSQVLQNNDLVEEEIRSNQKCLHIINQDNEFLKSSIQRIKQNVYNGTFITAQELNKRYNMMVNGKNVETERVDKLKKEIANLIARQSAKKESTRVGISDSSAPDSDLVAKGKKSKN